MSGYRAPAGVDRVPDPQASPGPASSGSASPPRTWFMQALRAAQDGDTAQPPAQAPARAAETVWGVGAPVQRPAGRRDRREGDAVPARPARRVAPDAVLVAGPAFGLPVTSETPRPLTASPAPQVHELPEPDVPGLHDHGATTAPAAPSAVDAFLAGTTPAGETRGSVGTQAVTAINAAVGSAGLVGVVGAAALGAVVADEPPVPVPGPPAGAVVAVQSGVVLGASGTVDPPVLDPDRDGAARLERPLDEAEGLPGAAAPVAPAAAVPGLLAASEPPVEGSGDGATSPDDPPAGGDAVEADPDAAREYAASLMEGFGWEGNAQVSCLDDLWQRESGWDVLAENPSSGAYGIPQSLPADKLAAAGDDWRTNPATQIEWGLGYIADAYGSPCAAWQHSEETGWY